MNTRQKTPVGVVVARAKELARACGVLVTEICSGREPIRLRLEKSCAPLDIGRRVWIPKLATPVGTDALQEMTATRQLNQMKLHPIIEAMARTKGYASGFQVASATFGAPPIETAIPQSALPVFSEKTRSLLTLCSSAKDAEATLKVIAELDSLTEPERKRVLRKLILENRRSMEKVEAEYFAKIERLERLRIISDGYQEIEKWSCFPLKLEKAAGSRFRELRKDTAAGRAMHISVEELYDLSPYDYEKEVYRHAEVFVVQHDWSAALGAAQDMSGEPFRLPYEVCAFEFQISGRRVIGLATEIEGKVTFTPATETSLGWLLPGFVYSEADKEWTADQTKLDMSEEFTGVINLVGTQIRAICIALEADVAKSDMVREPYSGHRGENSHAPLSSYRVVNLARRSARPIPAGLNPSGRRVRLHFRRGHWRHFHASKTWIKWMLVGDPELGFIDKEYRL